MSYYHITRKRFGQHFLQDTFVIQRLVDAIAPAEDQKLVEIGPGRGALTIPLLERCYSLQVIEIDHNLVAWLQQEVSRYGQLQIYSADVLTFDFKSLVTPPQRLRIVGNLPYNISTPLLFHLLNYLKDIQDLTFMLQREVVDRLVAPPGTSEYGRLSVMLQYHCQMEKLFDVSPWAFSPPPTVHSSVVLLKPHSTPPVQVVNYGHFVELVACAFSQRRKTLRNALKGMLEARVMEEIGIDPQTRAERLTLEEFARLANQYHSLNLGNTEREGLVAMPLS